MKPTDSERRETTAREAADRSQIDRSEVATSEGSALGIGIGIGLIILGLIAIARPAFATIASTVLFGWLFIIAGIAQIIYAFGGRNVSALVWKLLLGILYLGAGFVILRNILSGAIALTFILGATIFLQGVVRVISAFAVKPAKRWDALLFSGILGIILGIFIWSEWPFNVGWLLGVWVGVSLLSDGIWMIALSSRSAPTY